MVINMKKKKTESFFIKNSNAIFNFLEFILLLITGNILIFNKKFFIKTINFLLVLLIIIYIVILLFRTISSIIKKEKYSLSLLKLTICFIILYISNLNPFMNIIPILISEYALLIGFSYLITSWQYRNESSFKNFSMIIGALLNIIFGMFILFKFDFSLSFCGIYFLIFSFISLFDFIDDIMSIKAKNKIKKRMHIAPPVILTALIPNFVLRWINKNLELKDNEIIKRKKRKDKETNIEVLVHVTPNGNESFGHVDLCIDNTVISYGGYDYKLIKYNYTYGPGVIFEVNGKEEYIKFCQKNSNKSLFGFGINLSDTELDKLNKKLKDIKKNCYRWKCPIERNQKKENNDYSSLLHKETGAKFYKFKKGKFKHYFVLGFNCVKFVDELLRSCMDTVICGIISPGTYYDFLNKEFNKKDGIVISKTIYYHRKK